MRLMMFLILLTSCVRYPIIERCDLVEEYQICRCSAYDFNIPSKVGEAYSMEYGYCQEDNKVVFKMKDWQEGIVPTREAKAWLESSSSKKQFVKRLKVLGP